MTKGFTANRTGKGSDAQILLLFFTWPDDFQCSYPTHYAGQVTEEHVAGPNTLNSGAPALPETARFRASLPKLFPGFTSK